MVSPRKRSLVVRQMRSGAKTLQDSPEDWVSGSSFQFKDSPVNSKRVVEGRRNTSVFKRQPQRNSPKKRRQSMILKRLDLPTNSVVISPASNRRRTRRQSMAIVASKVTLADISEMSNSKVPKQVSSKANKSTLGQGKKSPKKDSPKNIETQKKISPPKKCSISLSPLVFYKSPEKKGKLICPENKGKSLFPNNSPPSSSSAKRKADHEATNKVDSLAKKFKKVSPEVSKVTKKNTPESKEVSPIVGRRKLRSEIPLKVDTSIKSRKGESKKVRSPKSTSSLIGKSKSSEEKAKSPKEGKVSEKKSVVSSRTSVSPKVNAKKSPLSFKASASPKSTSPVVKTKPSQKKSVGTLEIKEVISDSTNKGKLGKEKKAKSLKPSPKTLAPSKLPKTGLMSKKVDLSPNNKTSPKLDSSRPSGKLDKIEKCETPKPAQKVVLSSPKSSVQKGKRGKEEKDSPSSNRRKESSSVKVSPKSQQSKTESTTPVQEKHTSKKHQQAKSGEKLVLQKKTPLASPKLKKTSSVGKENKASKGKTILANTSNKKVVTIKTPVSNKRLDSPLGGSSRLTRSSRRVTLIGKSPRSQSFRKTPKSRQDSTMKENDDIGASPIFSAQTQLNLIRCRSPLRSSALGSRVAKVKPFTPKPDSPPSHVLRKTLKKNVAHKMHATTKVEIHQLMNGEISKPVKLISGEKIVTESVSITQAKVSSFNIAVTPRKALSSDHPDGIDKSIVNAATPASASNLPPTPTSSRKQSEPLRSIIANSSSRVSRQRSLLIATPRSSTPIEDNERIKPLSVDTIMDDETDFTDDKETETSFTDDKETNFTDDSIDTDHSEDEESVEDNKNVMPEKPKRSFCSLM
ncbi:micronuclear linker histone polyprotein-like [Palaemon carinicauda]|uniref:micronuclear linker histone polyprotein-like n=1 Tax=Palaemon carinicauda TaxID=392227 RepID=UPI0035B6866F